MNRLLQIGFLSMVLIGAASCSSSWGDFRRLGLEPPADAVRLGAEVQGSDCTYLGFWYWNSVAQAARDALSQAPGATALINVEIWAARFLVAECIFVRGTPIK